MTALNTTHARFYVIVKYNQYFSIGFAPTMTNCDMVVWQANGANSKCVDLYSTGHPTPSTDANQNYVTTFTYNSTHTIFTSDRALSTGDSKDYQISLVLRYL